MAKKTYLEKLGLEPAERLTPRICELRVRHLKRLLEDGQLTPKLEGKAREYKAWYGWKGRVLRRAA